MICVHKYLSGTLGAVLVEVIILSGLILKRLQRVSFLHMICRGAVMVKLRMA